MASLLIIGGTGFFGKSILDSFKRGLLIKWHINKVIVMSRHVVDFQISYPELCNPGVEFLNGNIATIDKLPYANFVIHAAASSDASRYLTNNQEEKDNIILGTLNYCRLAEEFHSKSNIVFCSSGAVYGFQPNNLMLLSEDSGFGDVSMLDNVKKSYAYAKRDSEFEIQKLGEQKMNVAIARCFSFVGKYLPMNQHFAIGNFIANGINGNDINVKADKCVYRSYLYADDLVDWLLTLASDANPGCPILNIGSDQEVEIRDLAIIVSNFFKVGVNYLNTKSNSEVDRYVPSITKAQQELNLKVNYDINKSILESIKNMHRV